MIRVSGNLALAKQATDDLQYEACDVQACHVLKSRDVANLLTQLAFE